MVIVSFENAASAGRILAMDTRLRGVLKQYFKEEFSEVIKGKLQEGHALDSFNVNPLVLIALSSGIFGEPTSMNMAKVLLYPRVFGTSVSTTFGDKMQKLCAAHLGAQASSTPGMDLEFDDKVDRHRVIMQLKAGPNTINSGDVGPMLEDMRSAYRLLRQNRVPQESMPLFAVGITYGTIGEISGHYRKIHESTVGGQMSIPILIGQDFWHRLTGDLDFYAGMIGIFVELFEQEDYTGLLDADLAKLASEIEAKYFTDGKFDSTKV